MVKYKRFFSLLIMLVVAGGILLTTSGCSSREKIYVFNCGDYIEPSVIELFEEAYPQYEIVYDTFDTNETMYQKLVSTNIPYDVLIPSDYMIERLINEGRLMEIDMSKITNYDKIRDSLKAPPFDPEEKYAVPYMWGTLGIVYNKTRVHGEIDSWNVLWDPQYKDEILMLDSVRDTMALSLIRLGYSMNTRNPDEINQAADELVRQKELTKQYGVDDIKNPMINGYYALCVEWSGDALWMMEQNEDLEYVIPKEGSNRWADSMVIPTSSKNYDGAIAFIDFMCSTEIAYLNSDYIAYSTPQNEALEMMEDYVDNHVFNPSDEELENTDVFRDLGDALELYNTAWEKLRLSTSSEEDDSMKNMLITYGIIIVLIIILVIISKIRKAKLDKIKYAGL